MVIVWRQLDLDEVSGRLRWLSLLSSLLVVYVHVGALFGLRGGAVVLNLVVAKSLGMAAVPIFFAISGFLLAKKSFKGRTYLQVVRNRFHTLLIPYVVWAFFYAVAFGRGESLDLVWMLGMDMTRMPQYQVLWYLRSLFLFVLVTPVLRTFLAWCGWIAAPMMYGAALLLKSWAGSNMDRLLFVNNGISPVGLTFFMVGIFLAEKGIPVISSKFLKQIRLSVFLLVGCGLIAIIYIENAIVSSALRFFLIPIVSVCFAISSIPVKIPSYVGKSFIGVYLMHYMILKMLAGLWPLLDSCSYLVLGVCVFLVSFALSSMCRYIPICRTFLFGGR